MPLHNPDGSVPDPGHGRHEWRAHDRGHVDPDEQQRAVKERVGAGQRDREEEDARAAEQAEGGVQEHEQEDGLAHVEVGIDVDGAHQVGGKAEEAGQVEGQQNRRRKEQHRLSFFTQISLIN